MKGWFSKSLIKRSFLALVIVILTSVVAYASGGGSGEADHGGQLIDFGWRILNTAILAGLLYWLLWDKVKEFFIGRRADIRTSLEDAEAAKEAAENKYKEYSDKLDKATDEIDGISDMIRSQGLTEKEKLIESARISAEKMKKDAQAKVEQDFKKAQSELRAEASELAIQMAEEILKRTIKEEDHENIVKDHLKSFSQMKQTDSN